MVEMQGKVMSKEQFKDSMRYYFHFLSDQEFEDFNNKRYSAQSAYHEFIEPFMVNMLIDFSKEFDNKDHSYGQSLSNCAALCTQLYPFEMLMYGYVKKKSLHKTLDKIRESCSMKLRNMSMFISIEDRMREKNIDFSNVHRDNEEAQERSRKETIEAYERSMDKT
jgi:hypothetical protein